MRILEVNNHSLLGMTHTEAVRVLRAVGDSLVMLVCDGFDPQKVAAVEVRPHEERDLDQNVFFTYRDTESKQLCTVIRTLSNL